MARPSCIVQRCPSAFPTISPTKPSYLPDITSYETTTKPSAQLLSPFL